jgi:hypothetical protein
LPSDVSIPSLNRIIWGCCRCTKNHKHTNAYFSKTTVVYWAPRTFQAWNHRETHRENARIFW